LTSISPAAAQVAASAPPGAVIYAPWTILGCSRSQWYRCLSTGEAPPAVVLPGAVRRCSRVADLLKWVNGLKPARRPRSRTPAGGGTAA
jgi:hypothetical protein